MSVFSNEYGMYSKHMVDNDLGWYGKIQLVLTLVLFVIAFLVFHNSAPEAGAIITWGSSVQYLYAISFFMFIGGMIFRGWGPHITGGFFEAIWILIAAVFAVIAVKGVIMDPITGSMGFSWLRMVVAVVLWYMGDSSVTGGINGTAGNCGIGEWGTDKEKNYIEMGVLKIQIVHALICAAILFAFRLARVLL